MLTRPIIAIVGRPNVGKSTIFNRLLGRKKAITADESGLTRDRMYATTDRIGDGVILIDTGGIDFTEANDNILSRNKHLRESQNSPALLREIRGQAEVAIAEANLVFFVIDARSALTGHDHELAAKLRGHGQVIVLGNKCESDKVIADAGDIHSLGYPVFFTSAEHGLGFEEVIEDLESRLFVKNNGAGNSTAEESIADSDTDEHDTHQAIHPAKIALVGRPNGGKSMLINHLTGKQRSIVSEVPGTTRDAIDVIVERDGKSICFVDTAGIRRNKGSSSYREQLAIIQSIRRIESSNIAIIVVDATDGPRVQDARIAQMAIRSGRGLIIALNKSDQITTKEAKENTAERVASYLHFVDAPVVSISARDGSGIKKLYKEIDRVHHNCNRRIKTSQLNAFIEKITTAVPPATYRGRAVRILFASQVRTSPPTFVFSCNRTKDAIRANYRKYLENQLRARWDFKGTAIQLMYRKRDSHHRTDAADSST